MAARPVRNKVATAVSLALAVSAGSTYAQDDDDAAMEEIVVTGVRRPPPGAVPGPIEPDIQLDPREIPIMGRLWDPETTVSWNRATTALSNVVTLDESPLLEGLLYVGTDDGLLQVSEDGGRSWREVGQFPGVPERTYVTDVFASPRDAGTVFATLNNYHRGDYKPYVVKSTDRGRSWTSISDFQRT